MTVNTWATPGTPVSMLKQYSYVTKYFVYLCIRAGAAVCLYCEEKRFVTGYLVYIMGSTSITMVSKQTSQSINQSNFF